MQPADINTLGFKLSIDVPSSAEEFDQLAKRSGACVDEANNNVIYRSVLAEFRDSFTEALAERTGIERDAEIVKPEVKNDKGEVTSEATYKWSETEKEYVARVYASLVKAGKYPTAEAAQAAFAPLAAEVMSTIKFDPSARERQSAGPKKTPKYCVEITDNLVEMAGGVEQAIAAFTRKTGRPVAAVSRDALAAAIWEDQKAQKKNIAAGYAG